MAIRPVREGIVGWVSLLRKEWEMWEGQGSL